MKTINLRDFYPWYTQDEFIEVTDLVADTIAEMERDDHAYYERRRYNRAFYSLNVGDGIEGSAVHAPSPQDIYEAGLERKRLYAALAALPKKRRMRVYQHYILGVSKVKIARFEGTDESTVREGIERGIRKLQGIIIFSRKGPPIFAVFSAGY
jgi:RNA polymerase sigma-70 factor (ECF subfamily)